MRFDTIIIGGGLSGLVCGIRLQEAGQDCMIISTGQNAMHFSSGSFDLLNRDMDGNPISEPHKAMANLKECHPYSKIGPEKILRYSGEVKDFFNKAGVNLKGSPEINSRMLSPLGTLRQAWLTFEDVELFENDKFDVGRKVLIANVKGYLDFNTKFIADGLEAYGHKCRIVDIDMPAFDRLRSNPSEMRSVNIAGVMEKPEIIAEFAECVTVDLEDEDTVVLPAVFGLKDTKAIEEIRRLLPVRTVFIGTMPPSIPGLRSQLQLKKHFEALGGTMLIGDEVINPEIEENKIKCVRSCNLGEVRLEADNFVLASGSYFSKGLKATPEAIIEPLFGLDTDFADGRDKWYDEDFFKPQAYLGFGVRTDSLFHPALGGKTIENLYAIGAVLGGYNPVELGCGAGVAIMTAFNVADSIIG